MRLLPSWLFLIGVIATLGRVGPAVAGPAQDADTVVGTWVAAFNANDVETLVRLYTADATLLGTSSPVLAEGTAAIHAYFARLPGSGNLVTLREMRTVVVGEDVVLVTGFYDFSQRANPARGAQARFTMLLVQRGGQWLIAHHHSSPRTSQQR